MEEKKTKFDGVDAYNIVSDTVTGVNVRLKDSVVQLVACVIGLLLGGLLGFILGGLTGLGVGCVLGLIAGVLVSGFFIMIYRFIMHIMGKHR